LSAHARAQREPLREIAEMLDPERLALWSAATLEGWVVTLNPAEAVPHLAIEYTGQPQNEFLWVAMERISGSGGRPHVFYLERNDEDVYSLDCPKFFLDDRKGAPANHLPKSADAPGHVLPRKRHAVLASPAPIDVHGLRDRQPRRCRLTDRRTVENMCAENDANRLGIGVRFAADQLRDYP
jgi:hypothetical protein